MSPPLRAAQGCRVIGLAGSEDKCAWLRSLGFDEAINYKDKSPTELGKAIGKVRPGHRTKGGPWPASTGLTAAPA